MKNLVDLLLIQNILSPVSWGREEVNQYLHLHQDTQALWPDEEDIDLCFLQQKSDRQPFFDYVASEEEKMTQEEFEDHSYTSSTTQEISHWVTEGRDTANNHSTGV